MIRTKRSAIAQMKRDLALNYPCLVGMSFTSHNEKWSVEGCDRSVAGFSCILATSQETNEQKYFTAAVVRQGKREEMCRTKKV